MKKVEPEAGSDLGCSFSMKMVFLMCCFGQETVGASEMVSLVNSIHGVMFANIFVDF